MTKCPYRANHTCKRGFLRDFEVHSPFCKMCLQGMLCDEVGLNTSAIMSMSVDGLAEEAHQKELVDRYEKIAKKYSMNEALG